MSFCAADFEEADDFDEEAAAALDELEGDRRAPPPAKKQKSSTATVSIDLCADDDNVPAPAQAPRHLAAPRSYAPPPPYVPQPYAPPPDDGGWSEEAEMRRLEGLPPPNRALDTNPWAADAPASGPRDTSADVCHLCKQPGHWAKDCPQKPSTPSMACPCGGGMCSVLTARTERNMGRQFYKCPLGKEAGCSFFQWLDEPPRQPPAAGGGQAGGGYGGGQAAAGGGFGGGQAGGGYGGGQAGGGGRSGDVCYKCNQSGHWARTLRMDSNPSLYTPRL